MALIIFFCNGLITDTSFRLGFMDWRYHRGSRHGRATFKIGSWKEQRRALPRSDSEAVEFCRGYCALSVDQNGFPIVFEWETRTIEFQEFFICASSAVSNDFGYYCFCPNTSKHQKSFKSLINNLNIGILEKERYHRARRFLIFIDMLEIYAVLPARIYSNTKNRVY